MVSVARSADTIQEHCFQLTLVRHGETEENRLGIIQGQADTVLSETGREQAKRVAQRLACESFTKILSSDLSRAKNTAEIIVSHFLERKEIIMDARLRERSFGICQGISMSELVRTAREAKIPVAVYTPPGGETVEQLSRRAREFFNELCSDIFSPPLSEPLFEQPKISTILSQSEGTNNTGAMSSPVAHVLVVTHGGYIRSLLNNLQNRCGCVISHGSMPSPNTAVTSLLISERREKTNGEQSVARDKTYMSVTVLCLNDIRHLK